MAKSAFQKMVTGDLRRMLRYFGRRRRFDGRRIWMAEHAAETVVDREAIGVQGNSLTLICEAKDLPRPPLPGTQEVNVDGEWWRVVDIGRPPGLLVLHLERASS